MISIVTQCTVSRLELVFQSIRNWNEIVSLAIYVSMEDNLIESEIIIRSFFNYIENNCKTILDISILYETEFKSSNKLDFIDKIVNGTLLEHGVQYPVNHLRNIALQVVETDFVFLLDADFKPNDNFTHYIRKYYQMHLDKMKNESNIALVIAAFEFKITNKSKHQYQVPADMTSLIKQYEDKLTQPFHEQACNPCHAPTNYKLFHKLATSSILTNFNDVHKPYKIRPSNVYEPYVIINTRFLNRYDARFRGYSNNKIVHLQYIRKVQKRSFYVLPNLFVFHQDHPLNTRSSNTKIRQRYWSDMLARRATKKFRENETGFIIR